ncbi:EAL domain-containing protein [Clostridium sp. B9]|uniref:EAL domain-containing protein n=1 Tax=Clostridium sp. B9 TaxID=3423224 RepID=UPI003D2F0A0D
MRKNNKKFYYILALLFLVGCATFILISNFNLFHKSEYDSCINDTYKNRLVKVGFYEYGEYYFFDKNLEQSGYYNDLLKELSRKIGFKYEYVNCGITDALNDLKEGKIDLLFGINKTIEREKYYAYTNQYIATENYAIYLNKKIKYHNLESLNGLRFAYIENEANNEYILNFFKEKDINIKLVNVRSYKEAEEYLESGKVDFIVSTVSSNLEKRHMKRVFEFSCGPVYIVAEKKNKELIDQIDEVLAHNKEKNKNLLYNKYFNEYIYKNKFKNTIILMLLIILGYFFIYKKVKIKKKQKEIKNNIKNENYILVYQPIVNPKNNKIVGLESLLRMKSKNGILGPNKFIADIENSNMLFDISIWIINKTLEDYKILSQFNNLKNNKFYISVNISFLEIENKKFIEELIHISKSTNFVQKLICLEIVERVKAKDIEKIKESISILRENGFIVAIDDFGIEYSNLDLLNKIDFDVIKLDKYFIDDIKTNILKRKIIEFICEICEPEGRSIVCEGVEHYNQVEVIKNINYKKIYIQGYFYSEPVFIEQLKNFKIENINN